MSPSSPSFPVRQTLFYWIPTSLITFGMSSEDLDFVPLFSEIILNETRLLNLRDFNDFVCLVFNVKT